MPLVHLSIPTNRTGVLTVSALAHGVEVESVDYSPGDSTMYVDATGTPLNILAVIRKTGAAYHGVTKYVETPRIFDKKSPAKPGQAGEGVPNDLGNKSDVYSLMGKPNFN